MKGVCWTFLAGGFKYFFGCLSLFGEMIQIDEHILEMVLVQPPTMLFYPNNLWKNEGFKPPNI